MKRSKALAAMAGAGLGVGFFSLFVLSGWLVLGLY